MICVRDIKKSNIEFKNEVFEQSEKARKYLLSFNWCKKILNGWLVDEFAYMLCIFCFKIEPTELSNADDKLWIIDGDLPSAYLDMESYTNAYDALRFYCLLMEEWIDHVNKGESVDECYPIYVPPTKEYANMLQTRINIVKEDFLPFVSAIDIIFPE